MSARHRILTAALLCAMANAYGEDNELSPAMQAKRLGLAGKRAQDEKKPGEAVAAYDKLVALKQPLPNEFWYFYGLALRDVGRFPDAKSALLKYVKLTGDTGRNTEAALLMLDQLDAQIEKDRARAEAERARVEAESAKIRARQQQEADRKAVVAKFLVDNPPFRDCDKCPLMVPIPMPRIETARADKKDKPNGNEVVSGGTKSEVLLISRFEVTRSEFAEFAAQTNFKPSDSCLTLERSSLQVRRSRTWESPGFDQSPLHPVVCVSWFEAKAYANWLSLTTGRNYRLPTQAEWEYAAIGEEDSRLRFWDDDTALQCRHANGADQAFLSSNQNSQIPAAPCDDGAVKTEIVGHYLPNQFGLHDMLGNVSEWVHNTLTADGPRWIMCENNGCRIFKGGNWMTPPAELRANASPGAHWSGYRADFIGFRVAASSIKRPTPYPAAAGTPAPTLGIAITDAAVSPADKKPSIQANSASFGAKVVDCNEHGNAWRAGIRANDVIIAFDGVPVMRAEDIPDLLPRYRIGDSVSVRVQRGSELIHLSLTLESTSR